MIQSEKTKKSLIKGVHWGSRWVGSWSNSLMSFYWRLKIQKPLKGFENNKSSKKIGIENKINRGFCRRISKSKSIVFSGKRAFHAFPELQIMFFSPRYFWMSSNKKHM